MFHVPVNVSLTKHVRDESVQAIDCMDIENNIHNKNGKIPKIAKTNHKTNKLGRVK